MRIDYPTLEEVRLAIKLRNHGKLNEWHELLELPSSIKQHRIWEAIQEYCKTIDAQDDRRATIEQLELGVQQ